MSGTHHTHSCRPKSSQFVVELVFSLPWQKPINRRRQNQKLRHKPPRRSKKLCQNTSSSSSSSSLPSSSRSLHTFFGVCCPEAGGACEECAALVVIITTFQTPMECRKLYARIVLLRRLVDFVVAAVSRLIHPQRLVSIVAKQDSCHCREILVKRRIDS